METLGQARPVGVEAESSRTDTEGEAQTITRPDIGIGPQRLPAPDPAAIGRMEEALGWSAWLKPIDSRIVWQRANGRRWKEICASVGLARAAAHEHWSYALCLIAWRLNGKDGSKRVGMRRHIARVRFGTVSGPTA